MGHRGVVTVATTVGLVRISGGTDIAMLLGPLFVGALLTLVYDKIEAAARVEKQLRLEVQQAQRKLLAQERTEGASDERERVSREIHDTVTQGLASNILLLEAAQQAWPRPEGRDAVRAASSALRRNLADTRTLVHQLTAPEADDLSLPEMILAAAPYVSGWDGTTVKEQVRLIAWGENQETSNNV